MEPLKGWEVSPAQCLISCPLQRRSSFDVLAPVLPPGDAALHLAQVATGHLVSRVTTGGDAARAGSVAARSRRSRPPPKGHLFAVGEDLGDIAGLHAHR